MNREIIQRAPGLLTANTDPVLCQDQSIKRLRPNVVVPDAAKKQHPAPGFSRDFRTVDCLSVQ